MFEANDIAHTFGKLPGLAATCTPFGPRARRGETACAGAGRAGSASLIEKFFCHMCLTFLVG